MHEPPNEADARHDDAPPNADPDRRSFLERAASLSMAAGVVASYGTLAAYATRFLFSVQDDRVWLFVTDAASLAPGDSIPFESPTGVRVTVVRRARPDAEQASATASSTTSSASASSEAGASSKSNDDSPAADEFVALSSVCPHLGCRVHWESQNRRYFCPCHNGEFDPQGKATGGPPAAAGQELPRYPVRVENGLVFLEMPLNSVGVDRSVFLQS